MKWRRGQISAGEQSSAAPIYLPSREYNSPLLFFSALSMVLKRFTEGEDKSKCSLSFFKFDEWVMLFWKANNMELNPSAHEQHSLKSLSPVTDYALDHLSVHLYQAGHSTKLYKLLVRNQDWMKTKRLHRYGDASFLNDLDLAISTLEDPLKPEELFHLIQLFTTKQVVYERIKVYYDIDLQTLVLLGREIEAATQARLRGDKKDCFDGLFTVYEAIPHLNFLKLSLLGEVITVARAIDNIKHRVEALLTMALHLAENCDDRALQLLREALTAAVKIEGDKSRPEALTNVAITVVRAKNHGELEIYNDAILELNKEKPFLIADGQRRIVKALAMANHFEKAINLVEEIKDPFYQDWAVKDLIEGLIEIRQIDQAEQYSFSIRSSSLRENALKDIYIARIREGKLDMVIRSLQNLQEPNQRVEILVTLGEQSITVKRDLFDDIYEGILKQHLSFLPPEDKMKALCRLAEALSRAGDDRSDQLYKEAILLAHGVENLQSLGELSASLIRAGRIDAALEFISNQALKADQSTVYMEIGFALGIKGQFQKCFEILVKTKYRWQRLQTIKELIITFANSGQIDLALKILREMGDDWGWRRTSVLKELALVMAKTGDKRASDILEEGLLSAGRFVNASQYEVEEAWADDYRKGASLEGIYENLGGINVDYRNKEALEAVALAIAMFGEAQKALKIVDNLGFSQAEMNIKREAALNLVTHIQVEDALEVARSHWGYEKANIFSWIGLELYKRGNPRYQEAVEECLSEIESKEDDIYHSSELGNICVALVKMDQIDLAISIASRLTMVLKKQYKNQEIIPTDLRKNQGTALGEIAKVYALSGKLDRAEEIIKEIDHYQQRIFTIQNIANGLAQKGSFREAFAWASKIDPDYGTYYSEILKDIAIWQTQRGYPDDAFDTVEKIPDQKEQAVTYTRIASIMLEKSDYRANEMFLKGIEIAGNIDRKFALWRALALNEVATVLGKIGDLKAIELFEESVSLLKFVPFHFDNKAEEEIDTRRVFIDNMAKAGLYKLALSSLGSTQLDNFIKVLSGWCSFFEEVEEGLSGKILNEVTRITGWVRPDWQDIFYLLTES
jgi:hypothetical protein